MRVWSLVSATPAAVWCGRCCRLADRVVLATGPEPPLQGLSRADASTTLARICATVSASMSRPPCSDSFQTMTTNP